MSAAASVSSALDEVKAQFTRTHHIAVLSNYAASSVLAQQIVRGAEVDLFVSADMHWADYLAKQNLVVWQHELLGNRLVIVVPAYSKLRLKTPEDLAMARIQHLALGEPGSVPAGRYAKQALTKLRLWERLEGKIVPAEDVRHALAYVEAGSAEAAIVYATDAAINKRVRVAVEIPEGLTEPIRYPVVFLKHGRGNAAAQVFYDYLNSPQAAEVFRKYGFIVVEATENKK